MPYKDPEKLKQKRSTDAFKEKQRQAYLRWKLAKEEKSRVSNECEDGWLRNVSWGPLLEAWKEGK